LPADDKARDSDFSFGTVPTDSIKSSAGSQSELQELKGMWAKFNDRD
jgi:hypothetical protein